MGRKRLLGILAGIVVLVPAVPVGAIGLEAVAGEAAHLGYDVTLAGEGVEVEVDLDGASAGASVAADEEGAAVRAEVRVDAVEDATVDTRPEANTSVEEPVVAVSVPVRVGGHEEDLAGPLADALDAAGLGPGGEAEVPAAGSRGGSTAAGAGPVRSATAPAAPFDPQTAAALDSSTGGSDAPSRPSFAARPFDTIPAPEVAIPAPEVALAAPAASPAGTSGGAILPILLRVLASFLVVAAAFATGLIRRLHGGL